MILPEEPTGDALGLLTVISCFHHHHHHVSENSRTGRGGDFPREHQEMGETRVHTRSYNPLSPSHRQERTGVWRGAHLVAPLTWAYTHIKAVQQVYMPGISYRMDAQEQYVCPKLFLS